jgi:hypothetical protein
MNKLLHVHVASEGSTPLAPAGGPAGSCGIRKDNTHDPSSIEYTERSLYEELNKPKN